MADTTNQQNRTPRKRKTLDALYTVTIRGLYNGSNTGLAGTSDHANKPYEVTVKMSHAMIEKHGPLSAFKRFIAPTVMTKKYPDYTGLITHEVINTECDDPDLIYENIQLLNLAQLRDYVKSEDLDVNDALYDTADSLRQAIYDFESDPEGYKITEQALVAKNGTLNYDVADRYELARLNADFEDYNEIPEDLHDYKGQADPAKPDPVKDKANPNVNTKTESKDAPAKKDEKLKDL